MKILKSNSKKQKQKAKAKFLHVQILGLNDKIIFKLLIINRFQS